MELRQKRMDNHEMEDRSVTSLRSLISESRKPVFLIDTDSDLIFEASDAAMAACRSFSPIGELIHNVVHMETPGGPAFFDNRWLNSKQELISWNNKTLTKLVLEHPSSMPDEATLFTIRKMIAVLLHRLRSPMTGMQGYLDMVNNVTDERDQRKLSKVSEGLDYLFEIMDELELLHHAEAFIENESDTDESDAMSVIREILYTFDPDVRNRVSVVNNSEGHFQFNARELKQILTLLITNAIEHPSGYDAPITIEIESNSKINVTNGGTAIPEEIASSLYFPFVTTKANNLGIGLSLAQIIASRRHATILLSNNSDESGIRFSLYCSPVSLN
jgi:signal transduction histidine kinase